MMTKLLSLVLSFTILFTSVAPSYAQARNAQRPARMSASDLSGVQDNTSLERVNPGIQIRQRVMEAQRERAEETRKVRDVNSQLMPIVKALRQNAETSAQAQGKRENLLDYDTYEKEYLAQVKELERKLLRDAKSAEEQRLVKEKIAELRTDYAVALGYGPAEEQYEKYLNEHSKELEKEFKKAMEPYVKLALENYQRSAVAEEMLFFALGMGMISQKNRKNIANFYHRSLKKYMSSCKELSFWDSEKEAKAEQRKCEQALRSASYLAGFGEEGENSKDAELLKEFLLVGYKGIAAPAVLQTVASGLLALKAESQLENALMIILRELPYSPIDVTLSIFSVETWVKVVQNLSNSGGGFGTAQFAEGFEYSYYPTPEENGVKYKNKSNMWLDLGVYLAEIANDPKEERHSKVGHLLDSILSACIGYDNYGNLQIGFRPFVVGALAGGYEVPSLSRPFFAPVLQRDGSTYVPSPEERALRTKAWEHLSRVIKQSGFTNNQYISWYLYNLKKIDLDPETARYINNVLTSAFVTSGKKAGHVLQKEVIGDATRYQIGYSTETNEPVYMESRKHPTAADMSAYRNRETWKNLGFALDITLVVLTIFTLGVTLVKSGIGLLRTGTRVLKLARAGQMFAGGSLRMNILRVLSRARAVKGLPAFKEAASATVRDIVGLERLKIEPAMKEIRAARAAKKAPSAAKVAEPQVRIDVRVLNGERYMVPEGVETFYVRGQVQYVAKGTQPAELAKQLGVDVSEVVLAKDGSVAPKAARPLRNYSTGDGVNGVTGSQPLVGRPEKPVTIHPREVAPQPPVPASLVKPGEKAALVYQNGEWRAVSVSEELSKAEIAANFKVSTDDVDYVVKFADGTFAPEWAEYSIVWDTLQSPAPSSTPFKLTRWKWMKTNVAVTFDNFMSNLRYFVRFPWEHPVRAVGAAGSSFGLGGVAPVAIYAEAPAATIASQGVFVGENFALSATRTAETVGAVSTATSAGAEMAGATRTATQLGGGWSNPFWGAGRAVTDWRFLTPVGALPSAGRKAISKWASYDTYKKYRAQLNKWLWDAGSLARRQNPWFLRDAWKDFSNYLSLSYQEIRMRIAENPHYLDSLKKSDATSEAAAQVDPGVLVEGGLVASVPTTRADASGLFLARSFVPTTRADASGVIVAQGKGWQDMEKLLITTETTSSSGILYSGIPVMAIADLAKDVISWVKRAYARIVALFSPQRGTPKEIRQAGFQNNAVVDGEKVVYIYRRIAYNPVTGDFEFLPDEGALPKRLEGWVVYLIAEQYFFMPKAGSKTPEEIADNKVDNDMDPAFLFATPLAELVLQQKNPSRNQLLWILASGASQVAKLQAYKRMQDLNYELPSPVEVIEMAVKIQEAMKTVTLTAEEKLNIRDFILRLVNEGVSLPQMAGSDRSAVGETGVLDDLLLGKDLGKISAVLHDAKDLNRFLAQMKVTTTFNGHKKYSGLLPIYLRLADKTLSAGPRLYLVLGKGVSYTIPRGFVIAMDEKGQFKYVEQASESEIINGSRLPFKFMDKAIRLLKTAVSKRPHLVFEQVFSVAELQGLSMLLAQDTKGQKVGILNVRPQDSFEGLMQIVAVIAGADLGASMAGEFKAMFPLAFVSALIAGFGYLSPLIANLFKGVVAKAGDFKVIRTLLLGVMGLSFVGMLAGLYGTFALADASPFAAALSYIFAPINIIVASVLSTIASPIMKSAYPDPTQYASKNMGFTTMKGLSRFFVTIFPWVASVLAGAVLGKTVNLNWSLLVPVMLGVSVLAYYRLMHSRLASDDLSSAKKQKSISKEKAEQIYRDVFKEKLSSNVMRVALVYLTYGVINSVMLSSEMKLLYPDGGLSITGAGLLLSYFVRKLADSMIKNKIISDDQLTGIGIPLMVGGVLFYAIFPAASLGMWLAWVAMYLSTPVFGVVENSRMQNAVALHYEREREKIRADERLKEAERKNKIDEINAEERGVKNEATAVYNKANAMGVVSIGLLVLLSAFLQDWSVTAEMGKPMLDFINSLFGDTASSENLQSTFAVMAEKYGELFADKQDSLLTSLSLYRLGTLLPIVTAGILLYKNRDLVKEGWWNRALRSIAFSREDIARFNKGEMTQEEVYDSLHVEPKHAEALVDRVVSEMKTIQESVRGSVHALESEARLQSLMNRMVWLNNRIKVLMSMGKTDKLIGALYALRATASLFEKALEQNDVSQALRDQAKELLASVNSVNFEEDSRVEYLASLMIEQMQHLPQTKRDAFEYEVEAMVEAYRQGDLARFQLHYRNAKRMVPLSQIPAGVDEQIKGEYKKISQTMEARKYTLQATEESELLNYQPEVQVSLIGNLPYLAKKAKEIFDGTDVKNYETAKVRYLRSLKILLDKKSAGNGYDGIERDFEEYYQKAVATLALYLAEHPDDVERVKALFNDMNEVYVQFMGEDPVLQAERQLNDAIEAAMADLAAVGQQETVALQKLMTEMQKAGAQQEGPAAQPLGLEELQALYIAPLEQLLQLKQQGQPVDEAVQSEIAALYQRANQAMTQYLNAHPKEGAAVVTMHTQLDKLYTQIIGEAPTKEKVAELAKKSSGLMSLVDWFGQLWEDLLAWFKDGDDSPGANDGSGDLSALPSTGGGAVQLARLPGKKEVDAVIFDMDGTLLNTLGAWKNSTSNFLRSRGIEPPENIDAEMAALSLLEGARVLKERYGFKESPEELLEEVLATVRKFYEEDAMPKPGVPGVLQALKKQGIKICVATASDREFAEAAFKRTGLMEYIDFIITCDEVGVGKQNPLVYETALKKLGTDRKRTLVVEDALHALQTAKKAGFPTAGVYEVNSAADQSALQSDATYYVPSFQTVAVGN